MRSTIYILQEPLSGVPRYPGKANDPADRLKDHIKAAKKGKWRIHAWIRKLLREGLSPVQRILEVVPEGVRWQDRERYWIRYFKKRGYDLVNGTDGGEGGPGGKGKPFGFKDSEETRKKKSESSKRNWTDPEYLRKMAIAAEASRGKKRSEETCKKMSVSHTGKVCGPLSEEHKKSISRSIIRVKFIQRNGEGMGRRLIKG
jgi:hypothetical protein